MANYLVTKKDAGFNIPEGMIVAGVDEAGRGPLAGPVTAAAVILDPESPIDGLKDSKVLSEKKRELLVAEIQEKCLNWAVGWSGAKEIDRVNILQASLLAMRRAIEGLSLQPHWILVDGNHVPDVEILSKAIVKGDTKVAEISAASIIAKVFRDREMNEFDRIYPGYGFSRNKGYPTKQHLSSLRTLGLSDIHRRSFNPVRKILEGK